ncbi:hypothetical protein GTG28_20795 [Vibrio sp. OCN044]|uniref:Uncharacterized protein n=1 Tax=Vibrio tetraodonis subsp. pristinus TaxID=2695891 RepID=A0A6L8M1A9_9VIBR|nr:hypothetical protein [Vibrio tetraodonis]MYM61643.1 hypothetical protein [Vibrio tetraodonis subsp. pristinus]
MELDEALDATFGGRWLIGEGEAAREISCRYFFRKGKHIIRSASLRELGKGTVCQQLDTGRLFEVVDSQQVNATRYEQTLQVKGKEGVELSQWS